MSPQEFSSRIKSKYPQYQNVDDVELAQKMIAKYPQYKEQVQFDEPGFFTKAYETTRDLGVGARKSAGRTILGAMELFTGQEASPELQQSQQASNTTEKVGGFGYDVGTLALGGGAVSQGLKQIPRFAKLGPGLKVLIDSVGQGLSTFGIESMRQGEVNQESITSGAIDTAFPLGGKAIRLGADLFNGLVGAVTGVQREVLETALKRPGAAFRTAGLKGDQASDFMLDLGKKAQDGLSKLRSNASTQYGEMIGKSFDVQLPKRFVLDGLNDLYEKEIGARLTSQGLNFDNVPSTLTESDLRKIYNKVNSWSDYSPGGLNELAMGINKFLRNSPESSQYDRVVRMIRDNIRGFAGKFDPKIKEANEMYTQQMGLIDDFENVLRDNMRDSGPEAIRKTAEALGRVFGSSSNLKRRSLELFEKQLGVDFLGSIAGLQISDPVNRMSDIFRSTAGTLSSPILRNAYPAVGGINQVIQKVREIPGIDEATRKAIVDALSSGINSVVPEQNNAQRPTNQQGY